MVRAAHVASVVASGDTTNVRYASDACARRAAPETHRGAMVAPIAKETILEVISMRMWLEVLAVREAVPRHDEHSLKAVDSAFADAERAATADDGLVFARANRALHEAIEAPAPKALLDEIGDVWERLWQARRRMSLFSLIPTITREAQREHAEIVAAIRVGDARAAEHAMERHRESTLAGWRRALQEVA